MERRRLMTAQTPGQSPNSPLISSKECPWANSYTHIQAGIHTFGTHKHTQLLPHHLISASSEGSGPLSADVYGFSEPANHCCYSWVDLWPRPCLPTLRQTMDLPHTLTHMHALYWGWYTCSDSIKVRCCVLWLTGMLQPILIPCCQIPLLVS